MMDIETAEAQALMTAGGQILEKTELHHGPRLEFHWYKGELQGP